MIKGYCPVESHLVRSGRGAMLISLIITMVILSVLGAAMLSFFSTSTMSQLGGNSSMRAYYLAESGYRYADSELAHTSKSMQDNKLESLHDKICTLSGDDGKFHLHIYPYYYVTTADPGGTSILSAKVPGGFPPELALTSGYLKIETQVYSYSNAATSGNTVTFTNAGGNWPSIDSGTTVLAASLPDGAQTVNNVANYIDLESSTGSANTFPEINGTFKIDGSTSPDRIWNYQRRNGNRLEGITPVDDPGGSFTVTIDSSNAIILDKFVELHSTGILYEGESLETRREIVYHVPVSSSYKAEFHDTFEDKSHWNESVWGSHGIKMIGGDKALKVTSTTPLAGGDKGSLIGLNWASTNINLATAHLFAGNFLSYDSQVKMGFENTPVPSWGFDPSPIPKYYLSGISFRLDNNKNCYGLSFMRGNSSLGSPGDGIPDDIVPQDDKTMLVLWQQTNSGNDRTWLAYKDMSERNFSDDVENGDNGWAADGLWHITEHRYESSSHSWYYGQEVSRDYDTGSQNSGSLVSPDINLCGFTNATLSFRSWYETEDKSGRDHDTYDCKYVDISTNGGITWTQLCQITLPPPDMRTWRKIQIDLPSSYVGQTIKIRFRFNTQDSQHNKNEGWYIDDVTVSGDFQFPVNEATLMVRLTEGATVSFNSGGTTAIEDGDIVTQSNGAEGTVVGAPILSSGTWAGGDAAGIILLNNLPRNSDGSITTPFVAGALSVAGKGTDLATVTAFRARDNYIRAYYGDTTGCGTPNDDPVDYEKHASPRGEVHWPPDDVKNWSAVNDYITLVQWDALNTGVVLVSSANEPDAIIRTDTLTTPTPFEEQRPELGLHTFGDGSTNVFFDDFAIQAELRAMRTGFLPVIQQ